MKTIITTTILSTLLTSSVAFAPSSTFTPRQHQQQIQQIQISSTSKTQTKINNGSALHMNLFDRFSRVAKGTINEALKKMEDPEKILNQAVEDMQVRIFIHSFSCIF